jgi:excisionase family DNA binding protein
MQQDVYTTQDAAKLLGVSLRTIQLWVENGSLRAWKTPGGHRRVLKDSVDTLIQKRESPNTAMVAPANTLTSILVVEDNLALCKLYEATIRSWRLPTELKIVHDGFAALVAIGASQPNIIITDIDMPGMDGIMMLRKLREEHACDKSEIIVVTGLDAVRLAEMGGVPEGISVFLKPAPFALIQARIQEIANQRLGAGRA